MQENIFTGGCLCGRIRYRAAGGPATPSHCHCELCRKSSGAPFLSWASFAARDFSFTQGSPARFDSSPIAFRQFCANCGTQLTFQFLQSPNSIDVTLASLDEPAAIQPEDHIWTKRQIAWIKLDDGLPRFAEKQTEELKAAAMRIWTIGHSTLPADDFIALLAAHRIELLADVRRFPSSRRHPQFNREPLAASLAAAGASYLHFPELGGRREPRPDSSNTGWREAGFRGYADYMQTAQFNTGIVRLHEAASPRRCAIMCAEKSWQNCHRGLISDLLKNSGDEVIHIIDSEDSEVHPYTKPSRIVDGMLSYAADAPTQSQLDF